MRTTHPPACPFPECNGKTFSQQKGLKVHLKIHEGRDLDARLDDGEDANDGEPGMKKKRGGDYGRVWICDFEGCTKDFRSVFPSFGHTVR
jgi:general transcription factor IIIA